MAETETETEYDYVLADYICLTPCTIPSWIVHPDTLRDLSSELAEKGMLIVSNRCLGTHPKLNELHGHCLFYAQHYLTRPNHIPKIIAGSGPDPWVCFGPFDGPDKDVDINMFKYLWHSVHKEVKGKALCIQVTMVGERMEKGDYHANPNLFSFPDENPEEFMPRLLPGNMSYTGNGQEGCCVCLTQSFNP